VYGQQCGSNAASKLATVATTTGGAYASAGQPLMNTTYTAKHQNTSSPAVAVRVRPVVRLVKVAAHRFSIRVSAAQSFAGKYAGFQRYNGTLHRWVAVKAVALKASTAGAATTVLSVVSFRTTLKAGFQVRAALPQAQVGGCYAAGLSNTIKS